MRLLGLALIAWVLSACAAGHVEPGLDAEAKLFRVLADKACIYVVPSSSSTAVTVNLDGRNVATLDAANYLRLDVPPGHHVLAVAPASLMPSFLRQTPDTIAVEAEAGRCYFLRTLWREEEGGWRPFRVYLARVTEAEGQREVNVRTLTVPTK